MLLSVCRSLWSLGGNLCAPSVANLVTGAELEVAACVAQSFGAMLCNFSWWCSRLCHLMSFALNKAVHDVPPLAACTVPQALLAAPGTPAAPWPLLSWRFCRRCCGCPRPVSLPGAAGTRETALTLREAC